MYALRSLTSVSILLSGSLLLALGASVAHAQYRYVRIADTRDGGFGLDSARHAAINNAGTVAVYKNLPGFDSGFYSGNGGALTTIATTESGPLDGFTLYRASFNDSGQVAFFAENATPDGFRVYRAGTGGALSLIASSGAGTFGGFVPVVSINNGGNVAFTIAGSGALDGVYVGNGAVNTRLHPTLGDGVVSAGSAPSMNNSGSVSFAGKLLGAPGSGSAHMRSNIGGHPPDVIADESNDLSIFDASVINDGGRVAFGGTRFGAPQGIFTGTGAAVLTTFVDVSGPYSNLPIHHETGFAAPGYPSMNNLGSIAFDGQLDAGGEGLFTGADPTTSAVIMIGDTLFGREIGNLYGGLGREAINDAGEIAFQVALTDGTQAAVKAVPFRSMKWNTDGDGSWSTSGNWLGPVPNAYVHDANFTDAISADRVVTVDGAFTVGSMTFDNANRYTINGPGTITMDDSYVASVRALSGSHIVNAALAPARDLTVAVSPGASLTASNLQLSSVTIQKTGAGTLHVNRVVAGALNVSSGTVGMLANGTSSGASRVGTLTLASTATLDLNDNDLIVTSSDYATISGLIKDARNSGAWDAPGITSTAARTATPKNKTLGTITGAQYLSTSATTFNGFAVASSDTLVKFTYYGDTDFNGVVDFDDYARTDAGFNSGGTDWFAGDFDYNELVNFDDYALIDLAFNTQSGTLLRAMSYVDGSDRSANGMDEPALAKVREHVAQFGGVYATSFLNAVPEPSSALAIFAIAISTIGRRRRHR